MAWVHRGKRRYYYRSRRENGHVVRDYFGSGELAETVAKLDKKAATLRVQARSERLKTQLELSQLDAMLDELDRFAHGVVVAAMSAAGFHWHRGQWRKQKMDTGNQPAAPQPIPSTRELRANSRMRDELVKRARGGDVEACRALLPVFDLLGVDNIYGDLAQRSLDMALADMFGNDLISTHATTRKMEALHKELAGPNPSPIERLLVERVVAMWLHLHKLERDYSFYYDGTSPNTGDYQRSLTTTQKRYFAAIRELLAVRQKATPVMQVNIAQEQVNVVSAPVVDDAPPG